MTEHSALSLQPAWVLHYQPYRENSVIVNLLTRHYGKVAVVAKGFRNTGKKRGKNISFQPFNRFILNWYGRGELKTLRQAEVDFHIPLKGKFLLCGLYANELLMRLLSPFQPCEDTWSLYESLLEELHQETPLEPTLRLFEKHLLEHLGYALPLHFEANTGKTIQDDKWYTYTPDHGFCESRDPENPLCFPGTLLLKYAQNHIETEMLHPLKTINRQAINHLLGDKPLNSRRLFHLPQQKIIRDSENSLT